MFSSKLFAEYRTDICGFFMRKYPIFLIKCNETITLYSPIHRSSGDAHGERWHVEFFVFAFPVWDFHQLSLLTGSPLRQWCGWNSTQHQTWRRPLREEFVHASILCCIELYCFGVRRCFWKCTNKCITELQTLGGKNSSVFNACNSGLMLGGKFKKNKGDAGWKVCGCWVEIVWESTKTVKIAKA